MPWKEEPKLPTKTTVEIKQGQYTPLPSTEKVLFGPAKLTLTRYPDGRTHGQVIEGSIGPLDVAVRQHLERVGW